MEPTQVKAKDLKLADTVTVSSFGEWTKAIVKQVTADEVTLFRPYGTTADFSYTGGVICFIGIEEYKVSRNDTLFTVTSRKALR